MNERELRTVLRIARLLLRIVVNCLEAREKKSSC